MMYKNILAVLCVVTTPMIATDVAGAREQYYRRLMREASIAPAQKDRGFSQKHQGTYYHQLLEKEQAKVENRPWGFWVNCAYDTTSKAFDACNNEVPLADLIFGNNIKLEDVFLASRLAADGKMFTAAAPNGQGVNDPEQQYIALLAPMELCLHAKIQNLDVTLVGAHSFYWPRTDWLRGVVGMEIPIRYQKRELDIEFRGGQLFATQGSVQNTVDRFFQRHNSIEDFFNSTVLAPKGLVLDKCQSCAGIGDVRLYSLADLAQYFERPMSLQFGIEAIFPTADERRGNKVWELELGEGAYQFGIFTAFWFNSERWYFNPYVVANVRHPFSFDGIRRVPKIKSQDDEVLRPGFTGFMFEDFSEIDSRVAEFADQAVCVHINPGTKFCLNVGNYFVPRNDIKLGLFYDLFTKSADKFCVTCSGQFDTRDLSARTDATQHAIRWHAVFLVKDAFEIYVGSRHVLGGAQAPKESKYFVQFLLSV